MRPKTALLGVSVSPGAVLATQGPQSPLGLLEWEKAQLAQNSISRGHLDTYLRFAESDGPQILAGRKCKVFPGDTNWPSPEVWRELNTTLNGALIKGVPASSVCYKATSNYDEAKCSALSGNWSFGFDR